MQTDREKSVQLIEFLDNRTNTFLILTYLYLNEDFKKLSICYNCSAVELLNFFSIHNFVQLHSFCVINYRNPFRSVTTHFVTIFLCYFYKKITLEIIPCYKHSYYIDIVSFSEILYSKF